MLQARRHHHAGAGRDLAAPGRANGRLAALQHTSWSARLDSVRFDVLAELVFNMGWGKLAEFHRMLGDLEAARDAADAAYLLESGWPIRWDRARRAWPPSCAPASARENAAAGARRGRRPIDDARSLKRPHRGADGRLHPVRLRRGSRAAPGRRRAAAARLGRVRHPGCGCGRGGPGVPRHQLPGRLAARPLGRARAAAGRGRWRAGAPRLPAGFQADRARARPPSSWPTRRSTP